MLSENYNTLPKRLVNNNLTEKNFFRKRNEKLKIIFSYNAPDK